MNLKHCQRIATSAAVVVGLGALGYVTAAFYDVVDARMRKDSGVQTSPAFDAKAVSAQPPEEQAPPPYDGAPFVPVVVKGTSKVTTELGPRVLFEIGRYAGALCPVEEGIARASKTVPPSQHVSVEAEGAWCFEVKPGSLFPVQVPGELLDMRSDSYVIGDSAVERVALKLADGRETSVTAGAVSICDNDGRCAASALVEATPAGEQVVFGVPMTGRGDVVVYGARATAGIQSTSSAYTIQSFPEVLDLVNGKMEDLPKAPPEQEEKEALPEEEPDSAPKAEVYDEDAPELNRTREVEMGLSDDEALVR